MARHFDTVAFDRIYDEAIAGGSFNEVPEYYPRYRSRLLPGADRKGTGPCDRVQPGSFRVAVREGRVRAHSRRVPPVPPKPHELHFRVLSRLGHPLFLVPRLRNNLLAVARAPLGPAGVPSPAGVTSAASGGRQVVREK
jgi:hypothetical protein